jgi:hypothetical protein
MRQEQNGVAKTADVYGLASEAEFFRKPDSLALPVSKELGFFHMKSIYHKYIFFNRK